MRHHKKTLKNQIHLGSLLLHNDDPERKTNNPNIFNQRDDH